jgi:hypothetical protein
VRSFASAEETRTRGFAAPAFAGCALKRYAATPYRAVSTASRLHR